MKLNKLDLDISKIIKKEPEYNDLTIYEPMLAENAGRAFEDYANYVKNNHLLVQFKYDGLRARIINGRLLDRRGNDITERFPEFKGIEHIKAPIDGEIIAQSGIFEDISGRVHLKDKFKRKISAKKNPAQFMAFDMPLKQIQQDMRLGLLKYEVEKIDLLLTWLHVAETYEVESPQELEKLWTEVRKNNLEGLMLKRYKASYVGSRSSAWLKAKNFKEIVAEFDMYEQHPRGITLEQSGTGNRVNVNGSMASIIKKKIASEGSVLAEVQYMEQRSGEWRIPSFRGLYDE